MVTLVGVGAPLALAAGSPSLPITAALLALSGFFLGPFAGALFTARQDHAPDAAQAQVFTLGAGLKATAAAAGAALGGTISGAATATQLLLVAACPILAGSRRRAPPRTASAHAHARPHP